MTESKTLEELAKEMDIDSIENTKDDYLKYCFYESMRIDPPAPISTSFCMTEDTDIGNVRVRAGEMMTVNIH